MKLSRNLFYTSATTAAVVADVTAAADTSAYAAQENNIKVLSSPSYCRRWMDLNITHWHSNKMGENIHSAVKESSSPGLVIILIIK